MARVSLGGENGYVHTPIEVELWGRVFNTVPRTRTVKKKVAEITDKLATTNDPDELAQIYGEMLDTITVPTDGKRKTAGAVLVEKWQSGTVSEEELEDFAERLREEMANPPTRTPS